MEQQWRIIRLISNSASKDGGSLANISHHLPDVTRVDLSNLNLALASELGNDVANKFGLRLHRAFLEYGNDAISSVDSDKPALVDGRYIITMYRAALLAPAAFHDPWTVYLKLLQDFSIDDDSICVSANGKSNEGDSSHWLLSDLLKVACISAVSEIEVEATAGLLEDSIHQLTSERVITEDGLIKALGMCPEVLQNFRTQLVSQLTSGQRLSLLAGEEERALQAFQRQSNKVIGEKRMKFFQRKFLRKVIAAWRFDLMLATRANLLRKKQAFVAWFLATKRMLQSRMFGNISHVNCALARSRRSLQKLTKYKHDMQKIKRCYTSETEKRLRAAMGHIRLFQRKHWVRKALALWVKSCAMGQNKDLAVRWNETIILRRVFRVLQHYTKSEIKHRLAARQASMQQTVLLKQIKDMQLLASRGNTGEEKPKSSIIAKQERARQYEDARKRKDKLQIEMGIDILLLQRSRRRLRVHDERQQRHEKFGSKWATKKAEAESECMEKNKALILSSGFKNLSQKKQREVRRLLSIKQASTQDTERESSITSLAVIKYSLLEAKMAQAGIIPDELFRKLENTSSPINWVPFQSALVSCGLEPSEFSEIFQAISQFKQASSVEASIKLEDLQIIRHLANKYVGQDGARWKLYVSPIHQQQLIYNTDTDKQIFEKHIKKKHIRQMVNENLQDHELFKVRRKHFGERLKAHRAMVEYYAAKSIQMLYFKLRGRKFLRKQGWVSERRTQFRLRCRQAAAVLLSRGFDQGELEE